MPRGRRPKPTAQKKIEGNPGKRKLNEREPLTAGSLVAPDYLSERARQGWDYIVPLLVKRGVAGDLDSWAVEMLCLCYADVVQLTIDIQAEGKFYESKTKTGVIKRPNPKVEILKSAMQLFLRYKVEFGLTPAARSKVQTVDPEKDDKNTPEATYFGT